MFSSLYFLIVFEIAIIVGILVITADNHLILFEQLHIIEFLMW